MSRDTASVFLPVYLASIIKKSSSFNFWLRMASSTLQKPQSRMWKPAWNAQFSEAEHYIST